MSSNVIRGRSLAKRGILSLLVGVAGMVGMSGAQAALLNGQTVSFTYFFLTITSVYGSTADGNYVVGAGVEIPNGICCGYEGSVDFSDSNILVSFHDSSQYTPASFNGFRITDVGGAIASFSSATVNAITTMSGFGAANVSFDADNIWVNWQDLVFNPGEVVSIDISAVPEPGTLALTALGLLVVGGVRLLRS